MRYWNTIALCCGFFAACAAPLAAQTTETTPQNPKAPQLLTRPVPNTTRSIPAATAKPSVPKRQIAVLPTGLPLRVQLDKRYRLRKGTAITGRLLDAVYSGNDIVLPRNTIVFGNIANVQPARKSTRTWALLDGDVTPLKTPVLDFNAVQLPNGERIPLVADATERTAAVVKMSGAQGKQSLFAKAKAQIDAKRQSVEHVFTAPHKSDRALQFVYGQLPYHPQDIWAGTQFDAVLLQPLTLPDPNAAKTFPLKPPHGHIPPGTLNARLLTPLSSATDKDGYPVVAVLTQPYLNATRTAVILPTGTRITGVVTQSKPARSFSRNGTLRFAFRQIQLPSGALEQMHGQMTAVEGTKGQNVTVDSEGGAKANSAQGKFLAPLLLGAMASHSFDSDQGAAEAGAYSNGFGVVARIIGFVAVTPAVSVGFGFYSFGKSITRRWLMPGHNVVFAKNTRMQLAVADR